MHVHLRYLKAKRYETERRREKARLIRVSASRVRLIINETDHERGRRGTRRGTGCVIDTRPCRREWQATEWQVAGK
jgi:hypothetical protein